MRRRGKCDNKVEDGNQECPRSAEDQESPGIGHADCVVEVAVGGVDMLGISMKRMNG